MDYGTPEAHLEGLAHRLSAVHRATRFLSEDAREPFDAMLVDALRSVRTMRLLADHVVIAVAGRQSAGKTHLVRALYDLDHEWLSDNLGQGERVPILVIEEEGLQAPQGMVQSWTADGGFELPRPVAPEEFRAATTRWAGELALPLLRVPQRYFSRPRCGFLLLPGYEPVDDDNRPWQQLMRLALVASDACVLVTDGTRLAEQQDDIVEDIRRDHLASVEPIVVISKTELDSLERREELRATAAIRFEVPFHSTMCVGRGEEFTREWRRGLSDLLLRTGRMVGIDARGRQLKELGAFNRQIEGIVQRVRRALTTETVADLEGQGNLEELLGVFGGARRKLEEDYDKGLRRELGRVRRVAIGLARDRYDLEETWEGLSDLGRFVKETVTSSSAPERRMRDRMQAALREAGAGGDFAPINARLLGTAARASLQVVANDGVHALAAPAPEIDGRSVAIRDELASVEALVTSDVAGTLRALLNRRGDGSANDQPDARENLKEALSLLPAIATAYLCVVQDGAVSVQAADDGLIPDPTSILRMLGDAKEHGERFLGLSKEFVVATAGLLLVDAAVDGQIDTFSAVASALGAGGPWVASAVVAATVAFSASAAVAQHDARKRRHIQEAISAVIDEQQANHVEALASIMDALEARLRHRLTDHLGLDDRVGQWFWASTALRELRATHRRFLEAARPLAA